jgi:hypothetical protein
LKNKFSLIYNQKTQFLPLREHAVSVTETRRSTVLKETVAVGCIIHKKHIGYMYYVGKTSVLILNAFLHIMSSRPPTVKTFIVTSTL